MDDVELTVEKALRWLKLTNEKVQSNKENLTSLDRAIGDGDHGINMARGFQEVILNVGASDYTAVSDVLKDTAMTLMAKVGGASGPLYGTAFLKMATVTKGEEIVDHPVFTHALDEALQGIQLRGKANVGDKTLVDVWTPVVELFKEKRLVTADQLIVTAKHAMESTKDEIASKGRAAYLKERSRGHLDPGSVSSYYLFEALAEVMKEGE